MGTRNTLFSHKPYWRINSETVAFLGVPATQSQSTLKKPLVRLETMPNSTVAAVQTAQNGLKTPKSGTWEGVPWQPPPRRVSLLTKIQPF
jgi:hypothetical protein